MIQSFPQSVGWSAILVSLHKEDLLGTQGFHYVLLLEGLKGLPLHGKGLSKRDYLRQAVVCREA
jgi:hypothetical protein